jgi:hypothetical protein
MSQLDSPTDHSDNKLFLHFMGELLQTASAPQNGNGVNYDWFADALAHFDDFLKTTQRNRKPVEYALKQPRQLRLLESKTGGRVEKRKRQRSRRSSAG